MATPTTPPQRAPIKVQLRDFRPDDMSWVICAHVEVYRQDFGFDDAFALSIDEKMRQWLARADPLKRMWIAESDGRRVGCIAISDAGDGTAFLNFVLVLAPFRRRQLGRHLLMTALDHARRRGQREARLETYQCLEAARALYRRVGFRLVETHAPEHKYGRQIVSEYWSLPL
ncbi:MAG: GNAT family N-acetyltransferase [Rhodocyclaceae bacterium]|nr:GNAT family N-acetyltransferase [Rhodocyclaceae bacterium]